MQSGATELEIRVSTKPNRLTIPHDLHCHSRISTCAAPECTLELLVESAADAGLSMLGISDHIHNADAERLADIQALADRVRAGEWPVEVWVGAELSQWWPGRLPVPRKAVADLDYVVISPNHLGIPNVQGPRRWRPKAVAEWLLDGLAAAIEERPLAVSHPFYHGFEMVVSALKVFEAFKRKRIRSLFERAGDLHVAVELNARKVCKAPALYGELIALARGTGVRFALASDAHEPDEMAYGGPAGREGYERLLAQLGLTEDLVWTPAWWVAPAEYAEKQ